MLKGLALSAGLFAVSAPVQARVIEVGQGHAWPSLSAAAASLQRGDTVRIYPGRYESCAVLRADLLTVEGMGDAAGVVLASAICQGKAILVANGNGLVLRNLTLEGAEVAEGNGAGLRAEGGWVTVDNVRFFNDQDGILASDTAHDMVLSVRNSVFEHDGACIAACAHAIYAGHIARLSVSHSMFSDTQAGHAVKSRAARTEVTNCVLHDGLEGTGSYLIEAPNGGALWVEGNTLEKGPHSGNRAAIAIGTEGVDQPTPPPIIRANRFTNDSAHRMVFVRNSSAVPATLAGNVLTGEITALTGPGSAR